MEIKDAKMYSVKEIGEILGLERRQVYKLIDRDLLHAVPTRFKEKRRVIGKFIKEFLAERND